MTKNKDKKEQADKFEIAAREAKNAGELVAQNVYKLLSLGYIITGIEIKHERP